MKTPGLKLGTTISLLAHLVLLQGLVLAKGGDAAPVEQEVIVVELAMAVSDQSTGSGNVTAEAKPDLAPPAEPAILHSTVPTIEKPTATRKPQVEPRRLSKMRSTPKPASETPSETRAEPVPDLGADVGGDARARMGGQSPTTSLGEGDGANGKIRAGYGSELASWLNRFKQYPALARRRGIEGDAKVRLVIERSGALLSSSLQVASGSELLDASALAMVQAAAPFPRVPSELAGDRFEFDVPIAFRLH